MAGRLGVTFTPGMVNWFTQSAPGTTMTEGPIGNTGFSGNTGGSTNHAFDRVALDSADASASFASFSDGFGSSISGAELTNSAHLIWACNPAPWSNANVQADILIPSATIAAINSTGTNPAPLLLTVGSVQIRVGNSAELEVWLGSTRLGISPANTVPTDQLFHLTVGLQGSVQVRIWNDYHNNGSPTSSYDVTYSASIPTAYVIGFHGLVALSGGSSLQTKFDSVDAYYGPAIFPPLTPTVTGVTLRWPVITPPTGFTVSYSINGEFITPNLSAGTLSTVPPTSGVLTALFSSPDYIGSGSDQVAAKRSANFTVASTPLKIKVGNAWVVLGYGKSLV